MSAASPPNSLVIVGLGNPGPEYAGTRHNLGEACVRELASRLGVEVARKRWKSLVGFADLDFGRAWLVLPQTYMNRSGEAARAALRDAGVGPNRLWVVHDELDLPLCRLRIAFGRSAAGNNGVRSIIASLGTEDFWRFRIGVGKPASSRAGVSHVLGRWSRVEAARVPSVVSGVVDALEEALRSGEVRAMDLYNRAGSLGCEELP
ncbi:MAG TPA: aminoacyl-tRNA hydrolase [Candidatus Dormibacteraeota bacterium]